MILLDRVGLFQAGLQVSVGDLVNDCSCVGHG